MQNEINVEKLFEDYYDNFIDDLDGLLRIPSVLKEYDPKNTEAPFGQDIRDALDYMLGLARVDGFKAYNVDNYCGFIEWGKGDETVVILCHLDVVPASGEWTNPPFEPIIKNGRIYARGSSDDKGPLMATYYALKMLKDQGYTPNKKLRFFFGCDEESGSRCLEHYISKYPECDYGFSPDAEFPCIYAEKGISTVEITGKSTDERLVSFEAGTAANVVPDKATATIKDINLSNEFSLFATQNNLKYEIDGNKYTLYGRSAHGSTPEEGLNAALYLGYFLSSYFNDSFLNFIKDYLFFDFNGNKLDMDVEDDEMGHTSNNAAIFSLKNGNFSIISNLRYTKSFNFDDKMMELNKTLNDMGMKLKVLSNSNYHYVPKNSTLVRALLKSYNKWTPGFSEKDREPLSIGGGTYARDFKNAVAFGCIFPGETECMHMPDESADIHNLILSSFIIGDAIRNICD